MVTRTSDFRVSREFGILEIPLILEILDSGSSLVTGGYGRLREVTGGRDT